jgi:hypothetical protein
MSLDSRVGRRLSIAKFHDMKIHIELKSKRYDSFIAKVKDFTSTNEQEPQTQVIFTRVEETKFPLEKINGSQLEYITLIKNIKTVDPYET